MIYTKRQYLADCAANSMARSDVQVQLEEFRNRLEAGEQLTADWSEQWNAAYDAAYQLEQERADIERRFSRRRWTGADYATYELVAANID
jgi:hypothetical protein